MYENLIEVITVCFNRFILYLQTAGANENVLLKELKCKELKFPQQNKIHVCYTPMVQLIGRTFSLRENNTYATGIIGVGKNDQTGEQ